MSNVEAEQLRVHRVCLDREIVRSSQHQAAFPHFHVDLRMGPIQPEGGSHRVGTMVRLTDEELGRREGSAEVLHQTFDARVVRSGRRIELHGTAHLKVHQVQEYLQSHVGRQLAVRRHDPALGLDLVGILRRENIQRAWCVQVDGAVCAGGDQAHGTVKHNAPTGVIGAATRRIWLDGIQAADQVDPFAGADGLANPNLMIRLNAHRGIAGEVNDLAP